MVAGAITNRTTGMYQYNHMSSYSLLISLQSNNKAPTPEIPFDTKFHNFFKQSLEVREWVPV